MRLTPSEQWCVQSIIRHAEGDSADTIVAMLRANGYHRVADAVATHFDNPPDYFEVRWMWAGEATDADDALAQAREWLSSEPDAEVTSP